MKKTQGKKIKVKKLFKGSFNLDMTLKKKPNMMKERID